MKRNVILCLLALTLLLSGCGAGQPARLEYIGADSAKAAAVEAAGFQTGQVSFSGVDMSTREGLDYYHVEFTADGQTYRYDIDALTGTIIDSQLPQTEPDSGNSGDFAFTQNGDSVPQIPAGSDVPYQFQTPDDVDPPPPVTPALNEAVISVDEAKTIALSHAGLIAEQATFVKSGLDWDDGRQTYDLEFYTSDYREFDYDIDPYTGEVLSFDHDAEYYAPPASGNTSGGGITVDEAKAIALAQVPGTTANDIREFETDYDDGRLEYEGKIYYDHMEYEFEIDGYSGAIRSWEVESIYD